MVADPISTSVFAAINTAFKLSEFGLSLRDAPEEIIIFCSLIQRVKLDRAEAMRESREKAEILATTPSKNSWIEGTIKDMDLALTTIGAFVESGRSDGAEGRSMTLKHRFEWVLSKKESFLTKQSLLSTCHHSLCTAIVYMQSLPTPSPSWANQSTVSLPSYVSFAEESYVALRAPSARRPLFKEEYTIPASSHLGAGSRFTEDWLERFASSPELALDTESSQSRDEASASNEVDSIADTIITAADSDTTLIATTSGCAGDLEPPTLVPSRLSIDRRKRNEARFAR